MDGVYYVVDELPEDNLPASISLANTWNLPKNSQAMDPQATGADSWKKFVFTGTTPSGEILPSTNPKTFYIPISRIEVSVAGANSVDNTNLLFNRRQGKSMPVNHLTFKNTDNTNLLLTSIRSSDALVAMSHVTASRTSKVGKNGMRWEREFADGSSTIFVYNPDRDTVDINNVDKAAQVILVHNNGSGTIKGREFIKTVVNGKAVEGKEVVGEQKSF